MSPSDRAREVLSMVVVYRFWSALWANRTGSSAESQVFRILLQFWNGCKLIYGLKKGPLDRAGRVLSMGTINRFEPGLWVNGARHFKKYMIFSTFFCSILDLSAVSTDAGEKIKNALDRARGALSKSVIHRFWSGLWANPYRLFWGTIGFQNSFAILDWLEADIWTKKESIGQSWWSSISGYHLKVLVRYVGESRSTFQEIYDFCVIFLKYLRFFCSFYRRWRKKK